MSSGDPPSPNRRVKAKPSLPEAAAPVASGEVAAPAANRSTPSKVDTSVAGDPKNSTQPVSQVGPAPKLETLGRYTILGELGRGGMGLVYLAEDTVLKRKVALKIPHFEPHKQEQMRDRFIREAQLAAQLTHRNICQVYDVGVIDDQLVMAMEYIEGRDLTAFTKPDKLLNARSAVSLIKKIAQALDVAHKKGLIHRDLKPSNIMLAQSDTTNKMIEPKVMDFGLAKSLESTGKQLTHSGMIVGTPCYMSKEQWSGKDGNLGPATDVFSLGVILYELLTGLLPYEEDQGEPATAWFVKLVTKEQIRPSVRKPGLDADLEAIVMKSIAKEVADRYTTMADFAAALDGWLKGRERSIVPAGPPTQSLYEMPFDFSQIAELTSRPSVSAKLPNKPPRSSPNWLMGAGGGAAALLLGLVLIFTNSKGEKTVVKTDGHNATLTTSEGTVNASTSPLARGGRDNAESPTSPPTKKISRSLVGTNAGDTREITLPGGVTLKQIWCPPGTFRMGSPTSELGREVDEGQVDVTLTQGFWLAQTEITQSQYTAVMGTSPWAGQAFVKEGPSFPASFIDDTGAEAYCASLTEIEHKAGRLTTGWKYLLPTEAQWEYACRAGTTTKYSFGDDQSKLSEFAWFDENAWRTKEERFAHAVRMKNPNPWGLYDMHGNLWEWCRDGFCDVLPGGLDPFISPEGAAYRGNRGGSWGDVSENSRSADRISRNSLHRYSGLGFRPALVFDPVVANASSLTGKNAGEIRETILPGDVKLKQLWCPPGTFRMGTPGATNAEKPVVVMLTKGFWLGQTEVTQAQWAAVMGSSPWLQYGDSSIYQVGADYPAMWIDYFDAITFCKTLTDTEHQSGRLPRQWMYAVPTEAQWEYACRAGTTSTFSFGDEETKLVEHAWVDANAGAIGEKYAHKVATRKPNNWGFFDIHGNVWEWCLDEYQVPLKGGLDPFVIRTGQDKEVALRGGGWFDASGYCRSAMRGVYLPTHRYSNRPLGFRVALVADTSSELSAVPVPVEEATTSFPAGERRVFTFQSIPFRWCPAGTFARGEGGTGPEATLTHGFWMGETEVTMEQWKTLMQNAPWVAAKREAIDEPNNPAVWISYTDVLSYCEKITTAERAAGRLPVGWKYTLPTGAQWEYACRAGTNTLFSFGNDGSQLGEYGWYSKNAKDEGEWYGHAVAQKKPNPWGLYDMHGNVWEWCLDWHHDTLPGGQDPVDSVSGNDRVFWGGGWYYEDWSCTSFSRIGYPPYAANPHVGFRLAIVKE